METELHVEGTGTRYIKTKLEL